mmetsp:Transcript_980/g.2217  ORF Transcript_980/g.2217 Transcript_980/m.2217 type:complete len:146 (-) Transcript_980:562-999(-)
MARLECAKSHATPSLQTALSATVFNKGYSNRKQVDGKRIVEGDALSRATHTPLDTGPHIPPAILLPPALLPSSDLDDWYVYWNNSRYFSAQWHGNSGGGDGGGGGGDGDGALRNTQHLAQHRLQSPAQSPTQSMLFPSTWGTRAM